MYEKCVDWCTEEEAHRRAMEEAGVVFDAQDSQRGYRSGNPLEIIRTENIIGCDIEIYSKDGEVWLTREQIGEALGYTDPRIAIAKIHAKHQERLDRWCSVTKLVTEAGIRETVVYNRRGVYEICRWSRQPKADKFYDKVYDILEEIVKNGFYSRIPDAELLNILCDRMENNRQEFLEGMKNSKIRGICLGRRKDYHNPLIASLPGR